MAEHAALAEAQQPLPGPCFQCVILVSFDSHSVFFLSFFLIEIDMESDD